MRRPILIVVRLLIIWLLVAGPFARSALAAIDSRAGTSPWPDPPRLTAKAAALYDPTSREVLAANDMAMVSLAPASTTKIVTCLVVLERCDLSEVVTVSQRAAGTSGASAGLRRDQQLTVGDLLYGLMLSSGNDAAVALAEHVAGTVEEFAAMMNEAARRLGAWSTNFTNPHGLSDPNHRSTAYDLAIIAAAALQHPVFRSLVASEEYEIVVVDSDRTMVARNTNRLLRTYEGADGVKTGTTREAGDCLIASATRDGRQLISVILDSRDRWSDSIRLLDYGFEQTTLVVAGRRGEVFARAEVPDAISRHALGRTVRWIVPVDLILEENLARAFAAGGEPAMTIRHELWPGTQLPLAAGQAVGTAIWESNGQRIAQSRLLAAADVPHDLVLHRGLRLLAGLVLAYLRQGLR